MKKVILFLGVMAILLVGKVYAADIYAIDPAHSNIGFAVKHMMVSTTKGSFSDVQGSITYDEQDSAAFKAEAILQAKSVNTAVEKRDEHLRGPDFLDVDKFPAITFVSKSLSGTSGSYILSGDLTIKAITKEVSFPVTISGPVGNAIGMAGQLTINRQDYGLSFSKTLDSGGLVVGNDVAVNIDIEAHKK
ncbi:MAG: YceI family protein [Candidatus Omnitrophica bacterium]|nr:YceI family protein [Candidatus Omnitrophota bacterium]